MQANTLVALLAPVVAALINSRDSPLVRLSLAGAVVAVLLLTAIVFRRKVRRDRRNFGADGDDPAGIADASVAHEQQVRSPRGTVLGLLQIRTSAGYAATWATFTPLEEEATRDSRVVVGIRRHSDGKELQFIGKVGVPCVSTPVLRSDRSLFTGRVLLTIPGSEPVEVRTPRVTPPR